MKLNKHFQMCEIDYLPLLCVQIFFSKSLDLHKIKRMGRKGIAVHEGHGKSLKAGQTYKVEKQSFIMA